jgi:hypothetical protein
MGNAQYIPDATLNGATPGSLPSDLNPGRPGVDFITTQDASIILPLPSGLTPIVVEVSVPNTDTNVIQITVTIKSPDGTVIFTGDSPNDNSNKVTGFPLEPLPEGSTITVTFTTSDGNPPENVTLSVIACYSPATATTIVTTGTPTVTSSTGAPTGTTSATGITGGTVTGTPSATGITGGTVTGTPLATGITGGTVTGTPTATTVSTGTGPSGTGSQTTLIITSTSMQVTETTGMIDDSKFLILKYSWLMS